MVDRNQKLADKRPIGQVIQRRVMEQVKFADRDEHNPRPNVDWFIDEIVNMSKFQADFVFIAPSDPVFDLKFGGKLHMLSNVRINERHESLLIEPIRVPLP